jgi:hypothetical protein
MKITYAPAPKSRTKKYAPGGVCFNLPWEKIAEAVQEYRNKYGYTKDTDIDEGEIGTVHVTDEGVQFTYKDSPL